MNRPNLAQLEAQCAAFNAACPVGGAVTVRMDCGDRVDTVTRSAAEVLSGHTAVVWLVGISGCYMLDRVTVLKPSHPPQCVLIESQLDADCGCPEETWETPWGFLNMHLSEGKPSNACLDNGDEGERHTELTAATVAEARAAIFTWAAAPAAETLEGRS